MTPMLLEAMLKNLKMRWLHKSFALACENDAKFSILAYAVMLQEKTCLLFFWQTWVLEWCGKFLDMYCFIHFVLQNDSTVVFPLKYNAVLCIFSPCSPAPFRICPIRFASGMEYLFLDEFFMIICWILKLRLLACTVYCLYYQTKIHVLRWLGR